MDRRSGRKVQSAEAEIDGLADALEAAATAGLPLDPLEPCPHHRMSLKGSVYGPLTVMSNPLRKPLTSRFGAVTIRHMM